jgi:hypothetical protein
VKTLQCRLLLLLRERQESPTTGSSSCRLCGSVIDQKHSKNLFKDSNREPLNLAWNLSGEDIATHENLPELLCRPCERRLGNFREFRLKVKECQKQFYRFSKRCVEVSLSLIPPAKATRKESVSVRTKLNFTPVEGVSLCLCHVFML